MEYNEKPVYMAVPLLAGDDEDRDVTKSAEISQERSTLLPMGSFVVGSAVGAAFAYIGMIYALPVINPGPELYAAFSIVWSFLATGTTYATFCFLSNYAKLCFPKSLSSSKTLNRSEYCFAIGDFVGYCASLMVLDVVHGVAPSSLLSSSVAALVWVIILVAYACVQDANGMTEDNDEDSIDSQGTNLPLVMV